MNGAVIVACFTASLVLPIPHARAAEPEGPNYLGTAVMAMHTGTADCPIVTQWDRWCAGFPQLRVSRPRSAVSIGPLDTPLGITTEQIVAPWNNLVGYPMFCCTTSATTAQIQFRNDLDVGESNGRVAWVEPTEDLRGWYTSCVIHYNRAALLDYAPTIDKRIRMMAHELGHCLGFEDNVFGRDVDDAPGYQHQCSGTSWPRYSPYSGIMSYCTMWGNDAFDVADRYGMYVYGMRDTPS